MQAHVRLQVEIMLHLVHLVTGEKGAVASFIGSRLRLRLLEPNRAIQVHMSIYSKLERALETTRFRAQVLEPRVVLQVGETLHISIDNRHPGLLFCHEHVPPNSRDGDRPYTRQVPGKEGFRPFARSVLVTPLCTRRQLKRQSSPPACL